jgi:hypothetical protein
MKFYVKMPSVHRFSCVAIMTMLLLGSSGMIEAMVGLEEAAMKSATTSLEKAGMTASMAGFEDAAKVLAASMRKGLSEAATKDLGVAAKELTILGKTATSSMQKFEINSIEQVTKLGEANLTKFVSNDVSKLSSQAFGQEVDSLVGLGVMDASKAAALKSEAKASGSLLGKSIGGLIDSAGKGVDNLLGKGSQALSGLEKADQDIYAVAEHTAKTSTSHAEIAAATKTMNELEWKAASTGGKVARLLKAAGGKLEGPLMMAVGTIGMAVLFMVPSLFQSAFLAQQAQNAMLQTYLPPIKFGNVVLQLPDSVVNMGNPMMSQFIYYGIPVNNPGESLSNKAKAMYPGVGGPTDQNKLSQQVDNDYAEAFSLGGAGKIHINRYNLDATALATLPIFVSYSDQSWLPWASTGIPDPSFGQKLINLNTGYILYADGTSAGVPPAALIGPKTNSDTVQSFMDTELGKLSTAGNMAEFREFVQSYSAEKAGSVHGPIIDQFNCKCLTNLKNGNPTNGILSSDTLQYCTDQKSCLLTASLNQLAAGLVINSQGQVMTPDQDLATEIAQGALGQVIPIQGLGANFDKVLQMFPGAQQDALANSGALTVSLGSDLSSASKVKIQGADPDNYTAKGVYIYQCKNTPLAKVLKSQSGGSTAMNNQITDFIVFLDGDLNPVPMMAPVQDLKNYGFISMGLNPVIKYFSTIIGSFDENGQFNFLPQLNIQSPAALVAKGLPASFPPLYGLTASNGSLAVNYNQNLPSAIGGVVQGLLNNPKLGQQFATIQSAMINLLGSGPYGQYNLQPVPTNMQPMIGGVHLNLYTGFNGYPVSQDDANANCSDVLIPLSAQGKTVTLPSNNVAQYYGLVTDLTYSVQADGSITVDSTGFAHSPLSAAGSVDSTKAGQFYWMDKLTAMGKSNDAQFVMPQPLVDFVQKARSSWMTWIQNSASSAVSQAEFMGVQVTGTQNVFTAVNQQALKNGLYLYSYTPCPSSSVPDYFVLTNSSAPQASDSSLGTMSATKATAATNMLSIVSGLLYNASGAQVKASSGAAYSVDSKVLLQSLNRANPNAFSNDLKAKLNISAGQAASAAMAMVYPFQFGNLQLGLYQADINAGVYLYFDASGAGASANFQPSDYFVTVDSYSSPKSVGTKLAANTQFVMSLVSGQVYGPAGAVAVVSASMIKSIIGALSPQWRSGVAADIANLTSQLSASATNDAQTTAAMNTASVANSGIVTFTQAAAMQVINNLASVDYLMDPYNSLKQDPASGVYVLVSPANSDQTQFIYTFFNVPSTILDAQGNPTKVGATYDYQGNLLRAVKGVELASMMQEYGVAVDSNGKQYLGASNSLPILPLDPADVALKPGMSGKSMIYSNDPQFPSYDIVSPISYQNSQFYFYYNVNTKAYYAMQVTGSDIRYIDMAGGCVYNLNGSPRIAANPVAVNSNGDVADVFLPYLNPDGFVRCFMKNVDNNGVYSDFYNSEQDFTVDVDPATNNSCGLNLMYSLDDAASMVNIAQMPFAQDLTALPDLSANKQYNVYFDGSSTPVSYNVTSTYTWQNLQILPIDMQTRALLTTPPAGMYSRAGLVTTASGMYAMVFAGKFYSGVQQSGAGVYTMKSGTSTISVSMPMDSKTNTQYVQVVASGVTYNYQLPFLTLTDAQFAEYRINVWQSQIVADVTGNIILEKYINIDSSGNMQLVPVSMKNVSNVPTDPSAKSALSAQLGNVLQDAGNGNFMLPISAGTYKYFAQDGYVDLENGVLFDATGMLVGYTLQYVDFMQLLSKLRLVVTRDAKGKPVLNYRAPVTAPINPGLSSLSASYTPAAASSKTTATVSANQGSANVGSSSATTLNTGSSNTASSNSSSYTPAVSSSASSAGSSSAPTLNTGSSNTTSKNSSSYTPAAASSAVSSGSYTGATQSPKSQVPALKTVVSAVSNPAAKNVAPAASVNSADAAVEYSNNLQVAKLQQQNVKLQADTEKRQKNLKTETIARRKEVLQNAIMVNQQQIKLNNKKIADLLAA